MERLLSNHAPDCRRWKKAWFQNPRQWSIQAGPCSTVSENPQWDFVSFILSRLVTIRARKSASIDLSESCWKDVDNGLKNRYSRLSSAYAWILGRWFLKKIPDANMINTIGPRQLPCGTVYIEPFRAVLVDESTLSATREKGPNPFLCVANNPEVSLRDF